MLTVKASAVDIRLHESLDIVHYQWITPPTSSELREAMNKGLEILEKTKATKWLGDVRNMGAINSEDQEWINTFWFPGALKSGVKKMAIVIGDDIFNQMSVEDIMNKIESAGFTSQYFPNPKDAIEWLSSN